MKSRQVLKILLISLVAAAIVLGVQVAPSSAGGAKEGGGGPSDSHLMGPAIFGTITLTDLNHDGYAILDFVGQCKGQPVAYQDPSWTLFSPIDTLTEKCTLCDGTDTNGYFEGSFWQIEDPSIANCSVDPDAYEGEVLTTVTKFMEIDLDNDGVTDRIVAQGIFLFDVPR